MTETQRPRNAEPSFVDLTELEATALPRKRTDKLRKRYDYLGAIAAAGSVAPAGEEVETLVRCRRSPSSGPCSTHLVVQRQQVPPQVRWRCPGCNDGGTIASFLGTRWDLSDALPEPIEGEAPRLVPLGDEELTMLLRDLGQDLEAIAVLHLARPDGERYLLDATPDRLEAVLEAIEDVREGLERDGGRDFELFHVACRIEEAIELERGERTWIAPGGREVAPTREDLARARLRRPEELGGGAGKVHRLRVDLEEVMPSVWRVLEVPSDFKLSDLARVLAVAFGWKPDEDYLVLVPFGLDLGPGTADPDLEPAERYTLFDVAPREGDGFTHLYRTSFPLHVRVESLRDGLLPVARCLDGRRAGPPDELDSARDYVRQLELLSDPDHPAHADLHPAMQAHDPDAFDARALDLLLRDVRMAPR